MARDRKESKSAGAAGEPEPDDVKYGAAVEEIEQILASIDRDEIDLDELGQKVERAVELLKICRAKLKATDARVTQVLKDLAKDEAADAAKAGDDDAEDDDDASSESGSLGTGEETSEDADPSDDAGSPKKKPRRKKSEDEELPF